jgi:two-component system response regulator YesN
MQRGKNGLIKVLIVDDEKLERVLLRKGFPWEDHGFEVIGEASSGMEALEFIKHRKPELIVTDINMPHMDGLKLAEQIYSLYEKVHVIIITGYREFEYARRAVKLGVEDFLLKPVDMNELSDITARIKEKISKENAYEQEVELLKQNVSADQDILMESFFQRLVEQRTSEEEAHKKLYAYGFEALLDTCCCLSVHLKEEGAEGELHKKAMNLFREHETTQTISFLHYMKNIVIFCVGESVEEGKEIASRFLQKLQDHNVYATIGISGIHHGFKGIGDAFVESENALSASVLLGGNQVITYEEYLRVMEKNPGKLVFDWDEFLFSLTNGISERVLEGIEDYVNGIRNSKVTELEYLRLMTMDLISKAGSTLNKYGESLEQLIGEDVLYEQIRGIQNVEECRKFLKDCMDIILHFHNGKKTKQGNKAVNGALSYINQNFCDPNLSLKTAAAVVYSNESYLSRVFKKEVGLSLIEYVMKKRIEESILLLNTTDLKVYEIAEKVGFRDSHYFSICFKKHVGVTVKEFKQR